MSSAAAISGMQHGQLMQQVSMKVAVKTLDAARAQGDAVVSLLDQAVEVQQQGLDDGSGKGQQIDVVA